MNNSEVVSAYINRTCLAWGVSLTSVLARSRDDAAVVRARKALAWLLRERFPELSFPRIGKLLVRDHTTIINSVRSFGAAYNKGELWALQAVREASAASTPSIVPAEHQAFLIGRFGRCA